MMMKINSEVQQEIRPGRLANEINEKDTKEHAVPVESSTLNEKEKSSMTNSVESMAFKPSYTNMDMKLL